MDFKRGEIIFFNEDFREESYPIIYPSGKRKGRVTEIFEENDWVKVKWEGVNPYGYDFPEIILKKFLLKSDFQDSQDSENS